MCQRTLRFTFNDDALFHDLSVVKYISKTADSRDRSTPVLINPKHPYTRLLLSAVPVIDRTGYLP